MTGDPGYSSAVIEVPQAEAATGTTRSVWSPTHGQLVVPVPPGTVDGAVIWVQSPTAGNVAVTIRVSSPFLPPQPYPGAPAGGPFHPPPGQGFAGPPPPFPPPAFPQPAFPPPAAPRNNRRNAVIGGTLVVLLALGFCGIIRVFTGDEDGSPRAAPGSAGPTAAGPLTPEQYVQVLAASDTALAPTFRKLNTSDNAAFAKAAPVASSAIRAESEKLRATQPPAAAATAHEQLTLELESLGDMVDESASAKPECPAASPWATVLQSGWADGIREDAKKLAAADPAYKFGTFLPAAPKETKRRLKTGTFLKRSSTGGSGHFKIKNGADDTTVSLVPTKGKKPKPILTVYVRGGGTFTAKGVRDGTYRVFTASGEDWDKGKKGFTRDCSFTKFDDTFTFSTTSFSASIWTITLTPVVGGNASTSDVDPKTFPN
jgi:hypothetical protein